MRDLPNVMVILGRCRAGRSLFGIRFEERGRGVWDGDWAFPVRERTASRERFDRSEIRGSFTFAPDYPGCPSCGDKSLFLCDCGKVACWDGESHRVKCPWCSESLVLGGNVDRLAGGRDA